MPAGTPRATIIDTDPGIDDAIAILFALASPEFNILAITSVAGNIGLDLTTRNAGRLLALAGRGSIPVYAGAAAPLARPSPPTIGIHGEGGIGGIALPEPIAAPGEGEASDKIAELLNNAALGSLDILALGPLTNIARLVADHPEAARRIGRLIAMGGAVHEPGNVGPRAEFNIAADPEAAEIVFRAGLPLTLIPLDATRQFRAARADAAELSGAQYPFARAAGALIEAYFATTTGHESRPLHDPCVMLLAAWPELFGCERLSLAVDCGHEPGALDAATDGRAAFDVALAVKSAEALALLKSRLMKPLTV